MGEKRFEMMYATNDTIAPAGMGGKDFCCCDGWWAGIASKGVFSSFFPLRIWPARRDDLLIPSLGVEPRILSSTMKNKVKGHTVNLLHPHIAPLPAARSSPKAQN
jgi:hypothetical protein